MVFSKIDNKILELKNNLSQLKPERKIILQEFKNYLLEKIKVDETINLTFICTHNSRRSFMCQIWAQTLTYYFNIDNVNCFSGGTEATALNPRVVKALRNSGFVVEQNNDSENPDYLVKYSNEVKPIKCFSKIYDHEENPQKDFIAIMTCSDADKNCPTVFGTEKRFAIKYEDPKKFDDTEIEAMKYQERFDEIGTEMIYVFEQIRKQN